MAGIDGMTYDQLLALANRNRDKDGAYNPYFMGNPDLAGLTTSSPDGVNPSFFLHNPDTKQGAGGQGFKLSRGADGGIQKDAYTYDSELGILPALAMTAIPFLAPGGIGGGLFGGASAGASATPAWTSGFDLAGGAALPTGAAEIGAGALSSGASGLAGSAASGAGELAAPGWISAEGGAGYAGGMAADAATGNAFTNALAGASKFLSNPLVQVGTSLVSGAIANNAAKKAADAQLNASREAIDEQRRQYDQTRTDLAPWRDRGAGAANRMAVMMGLSGNASDPNFNKGYLTSPSYTPQNNNRLSQMMNVLNQRVGVR